MPSTAHFKVWFSYIFKLATKIQLWKAVPQMSQAAQKQEQDEGARTLQDGAPWRGITGEKWAHG